MGLGDPQWRMGGTPASCPPPLAPRTVIRLTHSCHSSRVLPVGTVPTAQTWSGPRLAPALISGHSGGVHQGHPVLRLRPREGQTPARGPCERLPGLLGRWATLPRAPRPAGGPPWGRSSYRPLALSGESGGYSPPAGRPSWPLPFSGPRIPLRRGESGVMYLCPPGQAGQRQTWACPFLRAPSRPAARFRSPVRSRGPPAGSTARRNMNTRKAHRLPGTQCGCCTLPMGRHRCRPGGQT